MVNDYGITLPAATTPGLVHGVCVSGVTSAYALSTDSNLNYTSSKPFSGSVQGWGDQNYEIEGMEGLPCSGGTYFIPSVFNHTSTDTAISIDLEWTESTPTICVYVKSLSNLDSADDSGGFLELLIAPEFGFTNYGTVEGEKYYNVFPVFADKLEHSSSGGFDFRCERLCLFALLRVRDCERLIPHRTMPPAGQERR